MEEINFPHYDNRLEAAINEIEEVLGSTAQAQYSRWYSLKLFERDERAQKALDLSSINKKKLMKSLRSQKRFLVKMLKVWLSMNAIILLPI